MTPCRLVGPTIGRSFQSDMNLQTLHCNTPVAMGLGGSEEGPRSGAGGSLRKAGICMYASLTH